MTSWLRVGVEGAAIGNGSGVFGHTGGSSPPLFWITGLDGALLVLAWASAKSGTVELLDAACPVRLRPGELLSRRSTPAKGLHVRISEQHNAANEGQRPSRPLPCLRARAVPAGHIFQTILAE